MRRLRLAVLVLALGACVCTKYHEKQVIAYAKGVDVAELDPSLRSQRLGDWLDAGPARGLGAMAHDGLRHQAGR